VPPLLGCRPTKEEEASGALLVYSNTCSESPVVARSSVVGDSDGVGVGVGRWGGSRSGRMESSEGGWEGEWERGRKLDFGRTGKEKGRQRRGLDWMNRIGCNSHRTWLAIGDTRVVL
jgi:hypothetical protein